MLPGLTMIHGISSEVGFAGGTPPLQAWSFLPMGYKTLHHDKDNLLVDDFFFKFKYVFI